MLVSLGIYIFISPEHIQTVSNINLKEQLSKKLDSLKENILDIQ